VIEAEIAGEGGAGAGAKEPVALWLRPGTIAHIRALTVTP